MRYAMTYSEKVKKRNLGACRYCGAKLPMKPTRGPARQYCSDAHRVAAHRLRKWAANPERPSVRPGADTEYFRIFKVEEVEGPDSPH